MFVVGDVAGQFDTLIKLIEPFIGAEEVVLAGDLVDRGPNSRAVVQYAIDNPSLVKVVKGNHEDMMIDWYLSQVESDYKKVYDYDMWLANGGYQTLISYGSNRNEQLRNMTKHIYYLMYLPIEHSKGNIFVSHAPWDSFLLSDRDLIWHRGNPREMPGKLQIFGHNSYWGLEEVKNNEGTVYAMCIDTSASNKLTGILVDEKTLEYKVYSEDYI